MDAIESLVGRQSGNRGDANKIGGSTMEKVINEFRVVETDDGFRIEIRGDKEVIRRMLSGFGPHNFFVTVHDFFESSVLS
jgi:hypothetical protein